MAGHPTCRATRVRAAASRRSIADASNRVIATAIAAPFRCTRGVGIMVGRAAPIHIRVNGPGGWYQSIRQRSWKCGPSHQCGAADASAESYASAAPAARSARSDPLAGSSAAAIAASVN